LSFHRILERPFERLMPARLVMGIAVSSNLTIVRLDETT
jgi:hypothetical protein